MEEIYFVSYEDANSEEDAVLELRQSVGDNIRVVRIEATNEGWEITYIREDNSAPGGGGSGAPQSPNPDPGFW